MRVAVLGSTGMLGRYVYNYLNQFHECTGTTREMFNVGDASTGNYAGAVGHVVAQHDVVINCIGIVKPYIPSVGRLGTIRINSVFPSMLSNLCDYYNTKFIHICSDCVYSGNKGKYVETDAPDATDLYARTKSIEPENASIIRTSFIGEDVKADKSAGLLEWILKNRGNKITGYTNALWNGVTCLQLAKTINDIIEQDLFWTGVRHVFSNQIVSKYDICKMVNEVYDLGLDVIPTEATVIEGSPINGVIDRSLQTVHNDVPQPGDDLNHQLIEQKKFFE